MTWHIETLHRDRLVDIATPRYQTKAAALVALPAIEGDAREWETDLQRRFDEQARTAYRSLVIDDADSSDNITSATRRIAPHYTFVVARCIARCNHA